MDDNSGEDCIDRSRLMLHIEFLESASMKSATRQTLAKYALGACLFASLLPSIGCQVSIGGQTLPSAHYQRDDLQYFPKGPEYKLSQEAAALKAARAENMTKR